MSLSDRAGSIHYESSRPRAEFVADYRPTAGPYLARAGSIEQWLTERYCLYARAPDGVIWRNEVHHHAWPLQPAEARIERSSMLESHGLHVSGPPALLHFARRLDVIVWNGERVS